MDNYETLFDIGYLYVCHCSAAVCSRIIAFIVASAHLKSAMLKLKTVTWGELKQSKDRGVVKGHSSWRTIFLYFIQ